MHITLTDSQSIRRTLFDVSIGRYFNNQEILVFNRFSKILKGGQRRL